jgi:ribosome modulation factor
MTSRALIEHHDWHDQAAYRDGWLAHLHGCKIHEAPYNEKTQRRSQMLWLAGWHDRFQRVKYKLPMGNMDDDLAGAP